MAGWSPADPIIIGTNHYIIFFFGNLRKKKKKIMKSLGNYEVYHQFLKNFFTWKGAVEQGRFLAPNVWWRLLGEKSVFPD